MAWTEAKIAKLKELLAQGRSASQIAAIFDDGTTRNAVIGASHRHVPRIKKSPKPKLETPSQPRRVRPRLSYPAPIPETAPVPLIIAAHPLTLMQLNGNNCHYPLGGPTEPAIWFCGDPLKEKSRYCPYHAQLTVQPPRPR